MAQEWESPTAGDIAVAVSGAVWTSSGTSQPAGCKLVAALHSAINIFPPHIFRKQGVLSQIWQLLMLAELLVAQYWKASPINEVLTRTWSIALFQVPGPIQVGAGAPKLHIRHFHRLARTQRRHGKNFTSTKHIQESSNEQAEDGGGDGTAC